MSQQSEQTTYVQQDPPASSNNPQTQAPPIHQYPQGPYPPPQPYYPPAYPVQPIKKPRDPIMVVVIVVIVVVIIVISIIMASALLYISVIGFGNGGPHKPTIGLLPSEKISSTTYKISIADVNPSDLELSQFKVAVKQNGTMIGIAKTLVSGTVASKGEAMRITVTFTDLTYNQKLNKGDYFTFTFGIAPSSNIQTELMVYWAVDGSELGAKSFTT